MSNLKRKINIILIMCMMLTGFIPMSSFEYKADHAFDAYPQSSQLRTVNDFEKSDALVSENTAGINTNETANTYKSRNAGYSKNTARMIMFNIIPLMLICPVSVVLLKYLNISCGLGRRTSIIRYIHNTYGCISHYLLCK